MFSQIKSYFSDSDYHDSQSHDYLIVPDLHGTHSLYKKVEAYIKDSVEKSRTIIFLGDYMDRGESGKYHDRVFKDVGSYLVLRDLIALQKWADKENRKMIFLRGNHEVFYEDYFIRDEKYAYKEYTFFKNSIDCLSYVFKQEHLFYDEFISFLNSLQPYYMDKKFHYLFIHAGIDPDEKDIDKQVEDGLVYWIRDKFLFSEKKLPYTVVFGHTPFSKPFMRSDKIGLDSGVYKRGFINLLKIDKENSKVIQLHK
jgi:serine/threonine protein phosphatase 1